MESIAVVNVKPEKTQNESLSLTLNQRLNGLAKQDQQIDIKQT